MSEPLITIAREYLENATVSEISDAVIERLLGKTRKYVDKLQIFAEDYYYDNVSKTYKIGIAYLANVVLYDTGGNIIDSTNYDIDVFNGIVTFKTGYEIPKAVYATFNYFDFFDAIADLWLYLAAKSRFLGPAQLGDEKLPEDRSSRSYCIRKSWDYRQSKNIQMGR